jgi:signal transduction histidine kinase
MIWAVQQPDSLAVLGHEVRNLIATFVGFSELLLTHDWPPDKQREYLETMRDEGVRVSHFLNELLDLQRMEAGVIELKQRPVDLAALLKFAADVAAHDLRHPITLELAPDLPFALAEPDRIQQVMANLVSNARKYSPRGGPIHISSRAAGEEVTVCVSDTGVGMPPDALERVFDKFYRVESLMHRDVRGTGIGLAICRQIVEAHGGRIWAESAGLGQGARFCFTLPCATTAQRAPHKAAYTLEGEASPAMSPVT